MPRATRDCFVGFSAAKLDKLTNKFTDQQIAEQLGGCNKNHVGNYRRTLGVKSYGEKHGIKVGVKGVTNPTNRKHSFNERFFQKIDSEIKAYALGLFLADGCITKQLHRARFSLTEADSGVLSKIAEAAEYTGAFLVDKPREGNYQVHNMIILNFNSTVLVQDLLVLGLNQLKDNRLSLPQIDSELDKHLIRGLLDGDGCIFTEKAFIKRGTIADLSGRLELLESTNDRLIKHGFESMSIYRMKSIWRGVFYKSQMNILDWCYGCNPSVVIPRKLERYFALRTLVDSVFKVQ